MVQAPVAMVSTYAPTRCGIARFSASLAEGLAGWGRETSLFRLLQQGDDPSPDPAVVMEVDPGCDECVERARRSLEEFPAVVLQHEFGIYGPDDGCSVERLIDGLRVPVVIVLHTVPLRPGPGQRRIMHSLARSASTLVVPSNAARQALAEVFGISPDSVMVIPHGSGWRPAEIVSDDRRQILTWGLLGPGKGIERAILAIASLGDLEVPPNYRVVGQMHPNVVRRQGYAYRDSLLGLIGETGLEDRIDLDLEYKSDAELYRLVAASDVVVVPYDNGEQICSGVLTDAITAGRPVVATDFPHARELLAGGAGFVVGHDHPEALGAALRRLLTDDLAYQRAVAQARRLARRLSWSDVARRYDQVLRRATTSLAAG